MSTMLRSSVSIMVLYSNLSLMKVIFSITQIRTAKMLNPKRLSPSDSIPRFLVKDTAVALAEPRCKIFNTVINQDVYPDYWKINRVCHIFMKGKSNIFLYRTRHEGCVQGG